VIDFTEWARDILTRSHQASRRFNPDAKIRLARTATGVQAVLTDQPLAQDQVIDVAGFPVYVEEGLEGLVDVEEPHDRLVLRPAGSPPNLRGEH
jgi:hypothetical protein